MCTATRLGLIAAVLGASPAAAAVHQGGSIADGEQAVEDWPSRPMAIRGGRRRRLPTAPLVDFLYTYGAPSVAAGIANPGDTCSEFFTRMREEN